LFSSLGLPLKTWALFAELVLAGTFVVIVGARLTRQADAICDVYHLGRAWVGMLLLATITSLPEVAAGTSAVVLDQVNLAFGNILGSCCFNIAIIVLLDAVSRRGAVLERAQPLQQRNAVLSLLLLAGLLGGINAVWLMADRPAAAALAEAGLAGAIAVGYLWCMRTVYRAQHGLGHSPLQRCPVGAASATVSGPSGLLGRFVLTACLIVALSTWLTATGDVLSEHPIHLAGRTFRLGGTFVGFLFIAAATSLPEVVTCTEAVRIGQLEMALGNIFGSNMFNIFIMPMLKLVGLIVGVPVLVLSPGFELVKHDAAGGLAIVLTVITLVTLCFGCRRMFGRFGLDSILICLAYLAGMYLVFTL